MLIDNWEIIFRQCAGASQAQPASGGGTEAQSSIKSVAQPDSNEFNRHFDEIVCGLWLKEKISKDNISHEMHVKWNCEILIFVEKLQSYFVSLKHRPDVWIGSRDMIPVVIIEIFSNEDLDLTVGDLERGLLNQLRFYRNCDTKCTAVDGFLLPASHKNKHPKRSCPVLRVNMRWDENELRFFSKLFKVQHGKLWDEIRTCMQNNMKWAKSFKPETYKSFLLPLGEAPLRDFGPDAEQVPSGKSVVVVNDTHIYKWQLDSDQSMRFQNKIIKLWRSNGESSSDLSFISLPLIIGNVESGGDPTVYLKRSCFMQFERLIFPLTKEYAHQCLKEFLLSTAKALERLHKLGYAHLDVRLENVCFRRVDNDIIAVLIDLERMCEIIDDKDFFFGHVFSEDCSMYNLEDCSLEASVSSKGSDPPLDSSETELEESLPTDGSETELKDSLLKVGYGQSLSKSLNPAYLGSDPDYSYLERLDWKQWGLMAAFILENKRITNCDYYKMGYRFDVLDGPDGNFFKRILTTGKQSL